MINIISFTLYFGMYSIPVIVAVRSYISDKKAGL